jgi:hypothetical protein
MPRVESNPVYPICVSEGASSEEEIIVVEVCISYGPLELVDIGVGFLIMNPLSKVMCYVLFR